MKKAPPLPPTTMDPAGTAHDVLVIGAGLYGISFARTYLTLHPTSTLLILESSHSVGGPWSSERMYDAFWTQNTLGTMEWSDYPLADVPEAEVWRGFFPARYVAEYLERYVRREGFGGGSILERVRFGVKVLGVERGGEGGWKVRVQSTGGGGGAEGESVMLARKLVVASGLTSVPALPSLPGLEHFAGKVLHHHDLGSWERELELAASTRDSKEAPASRTVVLGGGKPPLFSLPPHQSPSQRPSADPLQP